MLLLLLLDDDNANYLVQLSLRFQPHILSHPLFHLLPPRHSTITTTLFFLLMSYGYKFKDRSHGQNRVTAVTVGFW